MPLSSSDPLTEPAASSPAEVQPAEVQPAEVQPAEAGPDTSLPRRREPGLRASRWRPFLCCAGALGVGMSLAPLLLKPPAVPLADAGTSTPEIALATEDTFVLAPMMPPGALLRGRVRLVAGATDGVGRASASGQVARQLVASGARVQRGEAVMEISSGAGRRVAPVSERRQNRAEEQQIAATDAQSALVQKINLAQTQLIAAQERVARAQAQTAIARDVVRRLQNGQSVASSEIPAAFRGAGSDGAPISAKGSRREREREREGSVAPSASSGAAQIASRQAGAARDAAQESLKSLQTARDTLADAQGAARIADEKRESATKAVASVEARYDAGKASGADVEAARAAKTEAQTAVDTADQALIFAKTEVAKREKNAAAAQAYAQSSAQQAAKALAAARPGSSGVAPGETGSEANSDSGAEAGGDDTAVGANTQPTPGTGRVTGTVTLDGAIRFAGAALDESRRASREAERIRVQVDGYKNQVSRSHSRIEAATQGLVQAQQGVMDSVPRPRFTACYAPSNGIITWVSRLAREVSEGDAVFGIARTQRSAARFEDNSGLWRGIKPGAILNAFVVDAPSLPEPQSAGSGSSSGSSSGSTGDGPSNGAAPEGPGQNKGVGASVGASVGANVSANVNADSLVVAPDEIAKLGAGHAIQLKMTEVQTPAAQGQVARLTGAPVGTSAGGVALTEGAQILVSLPLPNQKAALSVPASALIERGGATYLAVLVPLSQAEKAAQQAAQPLARSGAPTSEGSDVLPAPSATPAAVGEGFHLRWTRVETGRSDGMRLEIRSGVAAGARVVSQPEDLEAMGFAPLPPTDPTVFDKKDATLAADATSKPATGSSAVQKPISSTPDGAASDGATLDGAAPGAEVLVRLTPAAA